MAQRVDVELEEFRSWVSVLRVENSDALAACPGHQFRPLNPALANSNKVCVRCGGIVDAEGNP